MQMQPIFCLQKTTQIRELIQVLLRRVGIQVSATEDSAEVPQLVATNHFDPLLLDNWMPGLTGLELCKIIRSFDHKIPIFFCSGAVTEADKEAAMSAGAQGYISKPFTRTNSRPSYASH